MKTINVREVYTVDTISKTNEKAWSTLIALVENEQEDIMFDFKGIEVAEPWTNDKFKEFVGNEHVHMKLYSSQRTVNTIEMTCMLGGLKTGRFFNEDIVAPPTLSREDKKAMEIAGQLQEYFVKDTENEDTGIFQIYKRFDQIGSINTVDYIEKAIIKYFNETGYKNIVLDTNNIFIQKNILELFANVIGRTLSLGINLNVLSKDKEVMSKIALYQHLAANKNLKINDKYEIAKKQIPHKMVGMLTKYRGSKAVDEFGRHGNGEAISCRVAIFNGFTKNSNNAVCMKFTTYNGNAFYTQEHWALENDGEELSKMMTEELTIPLSEIGLIDKFLGSKYHFSMPIQYDSADSDTIYSLDGEGKVVNTRVTIPMRIKVVLDSWGIEYNEECLNGAIEETERVLTTK